MQAWTADDSIPVDRACALMDTYIIAPLFGQEAAVKVSKESLAAVPLLIHQLIRRNPEHAHQLFEYMIQSIVQVLELRPQPYVTLVYSFLFRPVHQHRMVYIYPPIDEIVRYLFYVRVIMPRHLKILEVLEKKVIQFSDHDPDHDHDHDHADRLEWILRPPKSIPKVFRATLKRQEEFGVFTIPPIDYSKHFICIFSKHFRQIFRHKLAQTCHSFQEIYQYMTETKQRVRTCFTSVLVPIAEEIMLEEAFLRDPLLVQELVTSEFSKEQSVFPSHTSVQMLLNLAIKLQLKSGSRVILTCMTDQFKKKLASIQPSTARELVEHFDHVIAFIHLITQHDQECGNAMTRVMQHEWLATDIFGQDKTTMIHSCIAFLLKEQQQDDETTHDRLLELIHRHFPDKDYFLEEFRKYLVYQHFLSLNVLRKDSISLSFDQEKQIIQRMKLLFGFDMTKTLEATFHDFIHAKETSLQSATPHLTQTCLSASLMPPMTILNLSPAEIMKYNQVIHDHFRPACMERIFSADTSTPTSSSRKVTYNYFQGCMVITARYGPSSYTMTMTTLQALVLLLIAEGRTNLSAMLPPPVMKRVLHSLAHNKKYPLLTPEFEINSQFKSKLRHFNLPVPIFVDQGKKENKAKEDGHTLQARQLITDATLIRIMKARKQITHQELMAETIRHLTLRFQPDPKLIKARIESLIEREYMERSHTPQEYIYVA